MPLQSCLSPERRPNGWLLDSKRIKYLFIKIRTRTVVLVRFFMNKYLSIFSQPSCPWFTIYILRAYLWPIDISQVIQSYCINDELRCIGICMYSGHTLGQQIQVSQVIQPYCINLYFVNYLIQIKKGKHIPICNAQINEYKNRPTILPSVA